MRRVDVNAPPCPTCEGRGTIAKKADGGGATDGEFTYDLPCPACGGSGLDRVFTASEIRAWIASESRRAHLEPAGHGVALAALARWLDERSADLHERAES